MYVCVFAWIGRILSVQSSSSSSAAALSSKSSKSGEEPRAAKSPAATADSAAPLAAKSSATPAAASASTPVAASGTASASASASSDAALVRATSSGAGASGAVQAASADGFEATFLDDGSVSKATLIAILKELTREVVSKRDELHAALEAGEIDSEECDASLHRAIPEIELLVNERFRVSSDSVMSAQTAFAEDEEVLSVSRELRNAALPDFAAKAMGEMEDFLKGTGTVPDGMTAEQLAELTVMNAQITIRYMKELVSSIRARGLSGKDAAKAFQTEFIGRAKELTVKTFDELGISPDDYAASMVRFMESPAVQESQMRVQQMLMIAQNLNMMELSGMSRAMAMDAMGIPPEMREDL